jgi:acetolactate synthase-1/2/3 large subunit
VTLPIVKHSYLITDINDIPRIVKEAFYIAQSGRPGPVVIDFPKNMQQAKTQPVWPAGGSQKRLRGYTSRLEGRRHRAERNHRPDREGRAAGALRGGGIITSGAAAELKKFAEAANIP